MSAPSKARHSVLRVVPSSQVSSCCGVSSRGSRVPASSAREAAGQVGHVRGVIGQPGEEVPGQLIGAERRAAQLSGGSAALRRIQVSQMPGRSGGGYSARHLCSVGKGRFERLTISRVRPR